ncbi:opioid growth factor receptor region [Pyrenophora seminiperda CCB06]|uniref:Opioid growth factor receptor region n=1 Tax=Pyrenophora seminiperda CCB06 TaxID=1302712 RepID=A0A3M7MF26_9PLEO|nr:opioid growth factor receptor region [Pyrenophora seminiperda CCB06]
MSSPEKKKVRSARASFFSKFLSKAKQQLPASSSQSESTTSSSASITQPTVDQATHQESDDTQSITTRPNKRIKMSSSITPAVPKIIFQPEIIIRFYDPNRRGNDVLGRKLEEILSWSDDKLEHCHNYIQMLFPLPEGSPYNAEAPTINLQVMQAFRSRPELRRQLSRSFERMLKFYDSSSSNTLQQPPSPPTPTGYHIIRSPNWRKRFKFWAVNFNHNHLRITRILRCLRICGLQTEYNAFFTALEDVFDDPNIFIGTRSLTYWRLAVTYPLHVAPDGSVCKWLEEWDKEHVKQLPKVAEKMEKDSKGK